MKYRAGDKVILRSFHNLIEAPKDTNDKENYWKLIGLTGKVLGEEKNHPAFKGMGARVLVEFDDDISPYGLHCHNDHPNTLWIFVSDLSPV
jgi:hypothetical protein